MKQCEMVVDRLMQLADEVRRKGRNIMHAKVESEILTNVVTAAFRQSQHQKLQRKTPKVKFFDEEIKVSTPEQKVSEAGKVLAKRAAVARKLKAA